MKFDYLSDFVKILIKDINFKNRTKNLHLKCSRSKIEELVRPTLVKLSKALRWLTRKMTDQNLRVSKATKSCRVT